MEEVSISPEKGETFVAPNFEPIKIQQKEITINHINLLNIEWNMLFIYKKIIIY